MARGTHPILAVGAVLAATACGGEDRRGARGTVGYTVTPPPGWTDITREIERSSGVSFDVAYGDPQGTGRRVTVNIARREARRSAKLAKLVDEGQDEVVEAADGRLAFTPEVPTTVDGAPALRYDFRINGQTVRQVGTLHAGDFIVVTLTAPTPRFERGAARLDALLRSWRWD